jgi:hypothetical protein
MLKPMIVALCLCLLAAPAWSQTETALAGVEGQHAVQPDAPETAPEKILIVGQRPSAGTRSPSCAYADREGACNAAVTNRAFIKEQPGLKSVEAPLLDAWVASAEKSLAVNTSTFAILNLRDILDPKGYVAALQAKGYLIEAPE